MCAAVNRLTAPRGPLFEVAGVRLTKEGTTHLIYTCNELARCLNIQIDAINRLPTLPASQAQAVIRPIQTRQTDINTHVAVVLSGTAPSACPWVNEFADARTALNGKVGTVEKFSREMGWVPASRLVWPRMNETYEWLLPLTLRLREETEQQQQQWQ